MRNLSKEINILFYDVNFFYKNKLISTFVLTVLIKSGITNM